MMLAAAHILTYKERLSQLPVGHQVGHQVGYQVGRQVGRQVAS